MCDTLVVVPPRAGSVILAKNSDREPGEAQVVEVHARATRARTRATWIDLDGGDAHAIAISRPAWMWGAEMGVNEHGLAIANEALFTRVPVPDTGLTGMDLLRLALERARDSEDAIDRIAWLIDRHGQGGGCGHRDRSFRYSSAFVIADPESAWVMETAGRFWAATRVRGARTASNVLSIGRDADRVGPGTIDEAHRRGWTRSLEDFDFARAFADPVYARLTGGDRRRACTTRALDGGTASPARLLDALRDHAGHAPHQRIRLAMPCAHASYWPTRWHGQTTGTMIVELPRGRAPTPFFTGTSSPCVSVLKPVPLDVPIELGPAPRAEGADRESLWWRHERLHRIVLRSYGARRAACEPDRRELEARALAGDTTTWSEHRERVGEWADRAARVPIERRHPLFDAYWARQSRLDRLEAR